MDRGGHPSVVRSGVSQLRHRLKTGDGMLVGQEIEPRYADQHVDDAARCGHGPKIASTRSKLKRPTKPQLIAPTITSTHAAQSKVAKTEVDAFEVLLPICMFAPINLLLISRIWGNVRRPERLRFPPVCRVRRPGPHQPLLTAFLLRAQEPGGFSGTGAGVLAAGLLSTLAGGRLYQKTLKTMAPTTRAPITTANHTPTRFASRSFLPFLTMISCNKKSYEGRASRRASGVS